MRRLFLLAPLVLLGLVYLWPPRQATAADVAVTIQSFKFNPDPITVPVGTTVTWTNQDSSGHTATSDSGVFSSPMLSKGQSFSFTFRQPGEYTYFCDPHPFMKGKVIVQASTAAPVPSGPADGARLESFGPNLTWANGPGTTQVHLQVVPANNDGPGVNVVLGSAATSFAIPAPPQWYGLLPDMTYTWRVRTSSAPAPADPAQDQSWTAWAERKFKTPAVTSATLGPVSPTPGGTAGGAPTLQWSNSRADVFYYEVQVSKDPAFGSNAFLYYELRHGGVTTPPNSYTIPNAFPLEGNAMYHWRVRPRVQGDGTSVGWAGPWNFTVRAPSMMPPPPSSAATATPTRTPTPTPTATPERMDGGGGGY